MRSPSVHPARIASVYSLSATRAGGRVCRAAFIMVRSALSVPSLRFDFAAGQLPVSLNKHGLNWLGRLQSPERRRDLSA